MLHILGAVAAGLSSHRCVFIRGEWHLRTKSIFLTYFVASLALLLFSERQGNTLTGSVHWVACIVGFYFSALFASMIVYRLFYHPLSNFPGPKLAAVSKIWHIYQSRNSANHLLMEDMHRRYGQLVRTGRQIATAFRLIDLRK